MARTVTTFSGFEIAEAPLDVDVVLVAELSWIPTTVRGGVHKSLLAAGRIRFSDNYFDLSARRAYGSRSPTFPQGSRVTTSAWRPTPGR